jgi:hypothetical protein
VRPNVARLSERATVPFEVLQQAVAGASKRIYWTGNGLAAINDGNVTGLTAPTSDVRQVIRRR